MKKLLLFLCFVCAMKFISAQTYLDLCYGTELEWGITMDSTDTIIYFQSFTDTNSYTNNRTYDTIIGSSVMIFADTDRIYEIVSVNGVPPMDLQKMIITVLPIFTISIDSIHNVTCPDGYLYPYRDGSFHVSLDDSVQNYAWIKVEVDTPFFFIHTSYDSVTLTNLRAGTYHVIAHGTNGCDYHDSVTIEQPEPWYFNQDSLIVDTVCPGELGCSAISTCGGTPPYNFTWFYFEYNQNGMDTVFMPDTTRLVCGLSSGRIYCVDMFDSRGCRAHGNEMSYIITYLYEYVEDSTHIITTDSIACYGREFMVQAQSIGVGTYTWYVGGVSDSVNYWTSIYGDSMFVADYITPPITEPTWIYAEFSDQHNCVTRDSIWVDVYNSGISLTVQIPNIVTDSTCTVQVFPPGGNLFVDGVVVGYSIPSEYTFSTDGISVGPHTLRYAGTFGAEMGVECDDETSQTIQVETNPFVPDWEYNVSIYPNPATTTLNLSSTGISDFDISILDITGKVIKTERMSDQTLVFDVSGLASGMYMLRLVSHDGASKVVKFVKR
jgi:hypothetical protein